MPAIVCALPSAVAVAAHVDVDVDVNVNVNVHVNVRALHRCDESSELDAA